MAPLAAVAGRDAIFWFTPIAAAALVWFAFVFGRRLGGAMAGGVAAVLTATSPIVLFQTVQPMNDITCAALWMAALVAATSESQSRHWWAGLLAGAAILVRPNLAPLALIVLAAGSWRPEPMLQFGVGMMPGVAAVLGLNVILYGSPLSSGYGDPAQLFSTRYLTDNVRNYASALYDTQNLLPLLALATPFVLIGHARRLSLLALGAIAMVFVIYAIYQPFPEWWYLRFLLPAVVLLLVLAAVTSARVARRARMGGVIAIATVIIALAGVRIARDRQAFDLQRMEGRYRAMANLISSRLPDRAVLITVWESGSVRFHAGREVVLWDAVDPDWLDRAVSWLNERERPTYILVERREENEFRTRFRNRSALGALDWPPRFDLNRQARVFDTADRARHLAGERYATENVR
jgi:hypothetical protein